MSVCPLGSFGVSCFTLKFCLFLLLSLICIPCSGYWFCLIFICTVKDMNSWFDILWVCVCLSQRETEREYACEDLSLKYCQINRCNGSICFSQYFLMLCILFQSKVSRFHTHTHTHRSPPTLWCFLIPICCSCLDQSIKEIYLCAIPPKKSF